MKTTHFDLSLCPFQIGFKTIEKGQTWSNVTFQIDCLYSFGVEQVPFMHHTLQVVNQLKNYSAYTEISEGNCQKAKKGHQF